MNNNLTDDKRMKIKQVINKERRNNTSGTRRNHNRVAHFSRSKP